MYSLFQRKSDRSATCSRCGGSEGVSQLPGSDRRAPHPCHGDYQRGRPEIKSVQKEGVARQGESQWQRAEGMTGRRPLLIASSATADGGGRGRANADR